MEGSTLPPLSLVITRPTPSLQIGPIKVDPPVVLAPMAGVTNASFRRLCRRFGAGLYVSEMLGARAIVENHARTLQLAEFDDDETIRSIQLYGSNAPTVAEAVRRLVEREQVDHIDMNFGCPVRDVSEKAEKVSDLFSEKVSDTFSAENRSDTFSAAFSGRRTILK